MGKLTELINIGATLERRLKEIGIHDRTDLERVGSAKAYKLLSECRPGKYLPVCYNLYSLEGALQNRHWNDLTRTEKEALLAQVKRLK